jgi:hypothetical protein
MSTAGDGAGAPAIEVEELRKVYPGGTTALAGVSFAVGQGEVFRLPRAERLREDEHSPDPGHAAPADLRVGAGWRLRHRARAGAGTAASALSA